MERKDLQETLESLKLMDRATLAHNLGLLTGDIKRVQVSVSNWGLILSVLLFLVLVVATVSLFHFW